MIDNLLSTETMTAGTSRSLVFYLYTEKSMQQIDANGMTARFTLTDFVNDGDTPVLSKFCSIITPEGEQTAVITVDLVRNDTLNLSGKYIYQVTINDHGTIVVLKGFMEIDNNYDKTAI